MIHKFKNDFTEFEYYNTAKMYSDFKAKYGQDFIPFMRENTENVDVDKYAFALHICHLGACKLTNKKPIIENYEDLLDFLTIYDLARCISIILNDQNEKEVEATKGQKKT
jgi:hypothetical protein